MQEEWESVGGGCSFVHSDIQKATVTVFMVDLTFQSLPAAKSRVSAAIPQKKIHQSIIAWSYEGGIHSRKQDGARVHVHSQHTNTNISAKLARKVNVAFKIVSK